MRLLRTRTCSANSITSSERVSTRSQINAAVLHVALLVGVLVLAASIRLVYLDDIGYNSDEAVYAGQAAAIAQVPVLKDIFPIFRAHPLLFQFILALFYNFGINDFLGRAVAAGVGVATILLTYILGRTLYGREVGLVTALFMAVMPYHVVVTRQVLLDGPMVFCSTLSLLMTARFAVTKRPLWLYAAAAAIGLTFLSKETGLIMVGAIYAFLALSPKFPIRIIDIVLSGATMVAIMAPFPLSVTLAGGGGGGKTQQYLVWQLFRRPNHAWDFYPSVVPPAIGFGVLAAALLGLWLLRREGGWRELLLVLWVLVPVTFFQIWPTKGFQYLLPAAPALAVLAARALVCWPRQVRVRSAKAGRFAGASGSMAITVITLTLLLSSWDRIQPSPSNTFLAGSGGVPGGREVGRWITKNIPSGATFMTIGPSMANIIKFYGHQQAYGLSVSRNPLHRNPSYIPIDNPDFQMRLGELQYLVWDSFSASRSAFFSEQLLSYVHKYNGRIIHTESVTVTDPSGAKVEKPVIVIYEVHP